MMRIKVLHIVRESYPLTCGYVIRTENIITRLRERVGSLDVVGGIFSRNHICLKLSTTFSKEGITYFQTLSKTLVSFMKLIEKIPKIRAILHYLYILLNTVLIAMKTDPKSYDLIHGHFSLYNAVSALFIAELFNRKLICDIHALDVDNYIANGIRNKFEEKMTDWVLKKCNGVIVIDQLLKERIHSKFGVENDKIFVAPNGVDYKYFERKKGLKELRKLLCISEDAFLIGLDDSKYVENSNFILRNFSEIKKRIPELQILVFNSKGSASAEDIIIMRQVPAKDMPNYYSILDLFVIPRLCNAQTQTITPLKLLEVMSCKVPVLVSDVGGLTKCITHNVTGFIFNVNDLEDAIENIEYIYKHDINDIAENAREWVIRNRNWEDAIEAYNKAYEYVMSASKLAV